jgi:hypothetical protein
VATKPSKTVKGRNKLGGKVMGRIRPLKTLADPCTLPGPVPSPVPIPITGEYDAQEYSALVWCVLNLD